jgi:arginine deiminase
MDYLQVPHIGNIPAIRLPRHHVPDSSPDETPTASPYLTGTRRSPSVQSIKKSLALAANNAASEGDVEELEELMKSGLDINIRDYDYRTPLHVAASEGQAEAVKWLIDHGAELNLTDRLGATPLSEALKNDHKGVAQLLSSAFTSTLNCSLWTCENDKADFVLFNDLNRLGTTVSNTLHGHTREKAKNYNTFFCAVKSRGIRVASIQDVVLAYSDGADFDDFLVDQISCIPLVHNPQTIPTEGAITAQDMLKFKKTVIAGMTSEQKAFAACHKIQFKLVRHHDDQIVANSYEIEPLIDVLDLRLQICTRNGVILVGNEEKSHRINLLRFVLEKLGMKVLKSIPDPLRMSGGDFILGGDDLAFVGVGLATDEAAARFLMQKDLVGTRRVAVVRDLFDRNVKRKHLDTVFKIISNNCVVVLESLLGEDNLHRRLVDEYTRIGPKNYVRSRMSVEFGQYLRDQGYHVMMLPESLYQENGISIYNLGEGHLLVPDEGVAEWISGDRHFKGKVEHLELVKSGHYKYDLIYQSSLMFRRPNPKCSSCNPNWPVPLDPLPRVWDTDPSLNCHQTTHSVLMVAPVGFQTNMETLQDNYFMKRGEMRKAEEIEKKALHEFSAFHQKLTKAGVRVVLFCSERFHNTPDAVFPNNWFSTHPISEMRSNARAQNHNTNLGGGAEAGNGANNDEVGATSYSLSKGGETATQGCNGNGESTVVFYPMKTISRRNERRQVIISELQSVYSREVSFVQWENSDFPHFLESTGVLIMDRVRHIAYATLSKRCYSKIAHTWAHKMGYELVLFHSTDVQGRPIYHTNVMMSVGTSVAIVCLESIEDSSERTHLVNTLSKSHDIVAITRQQMNNFCGNVLEIKSMSGRKIFVMSTQAYNSFTEEQRSLILKNVDEILHADITTIETIGGGGVRCMMGELF